MMENQFFFKKDIYPGETILDFPKVNSGNGYFTGELNGGSAILLFSLDINGTITLLEGKILNLLGIDRRKYIGSSIFELNSENHSILNSIKNAIVKKLSTSVFEYCEYTFRIYYTTKRELNGKITGIIGSAIDITDQKNADRLIKKKNEQISILYEAGKILSRTLNINALYEILPDIIARVAECDALFVANYDKEQNLIKYTYLRDRVIGETIDTGKIPPIPLAPAGYGIISNVVRSGKAVILNDYQTELKKVKISFNIKMDIDTQNPAKFQKESESGNHVGSAIIVPVSIEDNVFGVIQIFSSKKNAYTKEQLSFLEALMQPVGIAINNAMLYQSAQNEIKERKLAELKIINSLKEKELLLKEVHHRVKNNLQIVKSLISIQSRYIKDKELLKFCNESQDRIQSVALIHELLYHGNNIAQINFSEYIYKLTNNLLSSMGVPPGNHSLLIDNSDVNMSIDIAIPCGLIINELFTNTVKHAFPGSKKGDIYIKLVQHESLSNNDPGNYELIVKDNGIGLPEGFEMDSNITTLGMRIVYSLIKQLNGKVEINNTNGAEFKITFPPANYSERL